jgi:hypothetical protein
MCGRLIRALAPSADAEAVFAAAALLRGLAICAFLIGRRAR